MAEKLANLNRLLLGLFSLLTLVLAAPSLVKRSMYNDGVWYAVIARNLARGESSFWRPKLTETMYPAFFEHPPLGFGIQSLWFMLFGEGIATERTYAACIFFTAALLLVLLFRQLAGEYQKIWACCLVFWVLNEVTYVFFPANILEALLAVLTLAAVGLALTAMRKTTLKASLLASIGSAACLWAAFLTKGPVALFPLAVPAIYWLCFRNDIKIRKAATVTSVLTGGFIVFGVLTFLIWPESTENLRKYIDSQVLAALNGTRTTYHHRDNHFYILGKLSVVLLPTLLLAMLGYWGGKKKNIPANKLKLRAAAFAALVGLSASLPLAISPKQSYYYLLPAMPYFALSASLIVVPFLESLNSSKRWGYGLAALLLLLNGGALLNVVNSVGKTVSRDAAVIADVENFGPTLQAEGIVGASSTTAHLVGYLARNWDVAIDTAAVSARTHRFFIHDHQLKGDAAVTGYQVVIQGEKYDLLRLKIE